MNERAHFAKFKSKHRMSAVENIVTANLTSNGNGHTKELHDSVHLPERLPWPIRLKDWFRNQFGQGWEYVVVNKSVDSIVMPKWAASAILITILGFGVQQWWARSADHDTMIEIRTELRLAKEADAEKMRQVKEQGDMNKVYIDNMTNQLNVIRGMLSQQQLNSIDRGTKRENQN